MHLTERHRKLMGLPEPEEPAIVYGPGNLAHVVRCCAEATLFQCTCDWYKWKCRAHGVAGECHPTNNHD
ncbi:MAG TPA: hypothetical protein VFZ09_27505 [Archangium sp.]|uniref:hypothetical protein n=1 Tax=Archangium sp. TaxID=1872627 RepID=UPI002E34DB64|nr:hypothetical protein [Archangium sp.]HEX5750007.1 hypothetical protein [Archangium sp.]